MVGPTFQVLTLNQRHSSPLQNHNYQIVIQLHILINSMKVLLLQNINAIFAPDLAMLPNSLF
jgi:hypothetical protein